MKWICSKCGFEIKSNREKHFKSCNGQGPRRSRPKIKGTDEYKRRVSEGVKKAYRETNLAEKISIGMQKAHREGKFIFTEEKKAQISESCRQAILKRYNEGWSPKAGRCKKIEYISPIAGKISVDGSWELRVAQYLDCINVVWFRNTKRFKYFNTLKNKESTYCPDFYIRDWNSYLEIKGYETELDKIKWNQFEHNLMIWKKEDLIRLGILEPRTSRGIGLDC